MRILTWMRALLQRLRGANAAPALPPPPTAEQIEYVRRMAVRDAGGPVHIERDQTGIRWDLVRMSLIGEAKLIAYGLLWLGYSEHPNDAIPLGLEAARALRGLPPKGGLEPPPEIAEQLSSSSRGL